MYFYMHTYCHCVLEELLPDKLCGVCPNEFNIHLHSKFTQSGYEKIRIGYVLKSADVGTLFSWRNSGNSSHTCMRTPVQIYAHPRTIVHTRTHPHTPTEHPCTPAHTQAHPRTLVYTRAHPGTPTHSHTHPHTSHTYPLMPADALNLINQMNYM